MMQSFGFFPREHRSPGDSPAGVSDTILNPPTDASQAATAPEPGTPAARRDGRNPAASGGGTHLPR